MPVCAGTNTIAALLAGAIDTAAARELEGHLDACSACRCLVAELGRGLSAIGSQPRAHGASGLPRAGDTIGRYQIRRVVGVGGMGVVYEGHDATLDRRVALKLLRPDLVDGGDLLAEAKAMARLQHPNIAAVHDAGIASARLYVCMEYVAGTNLRGWVAERPRSWREIVEVYAAAGAGLAYVHRAGLVHLDFKPDNVLIDREGRVRVTDFGLARMVGGRASPSGPDLTTAHIIVGTPAYMAPEQRRGARTDARTDQFAFCASLREALAGVAAPRWLERVLDRGLSVVPEDRFPAMDDVLAALASGLRRRGRGAAIGAVASLAALAVAGVMTLPRPTRVVTHVVERPSQVEPGTRTPEPPAPDRIGRATSDATGDLAGQQSPSAGRTIDSPTFAALWPSPPSAVALGPAGARVAAYPPRRPPALTGPRSESKHARTPDDSDPDDVTIEAQPPDAPGLCDDGTPRTCAYLAPLCPTGTVVAVQAGCWTCADNQTCAPLGIPRLCNDGTRLTCSARPPVCNRLRIAAVRDGCWTCEDPFTCPAPLKPTKPPPRLPRCGNEVCERGETRLSCAADCTPESSESGGGSNGGGASCGNGFCESGETHAACAMDCCETDGSGACLASCGNGFCESGEDHATCAGDCCETTSTGACVPVCGNGFCETDETCPADCG